MAGGGARAAGGDAHTPVVVVGVTNTPWALDPSLLRPGRLEHHLYLPPPGIRARRQILRSQLRRMPLQPPKDAAIADDPGARTTTVDAVADTMARQLADRTEGFTGADLGCLCQKAALETLRRRNASMARRTREEMTSTKAAAERPVEGREATGGAAASSGAGAGDGDGNADASVGHEPCSHASGSSHGDSVAATGGGADPRDGRHPAHPGPPTGVWGRQKLEELVIELEERRRQADQDSGSDGVDEEVDAREEVREEACEEYDEAGSEPMRLVVSPSDWEVALAASQPSVSAAVLSQLEAWQVQRGS